MSYEYRHALALEIMDEATTIVDDDDTAAASGNLILYWPNGHFRVVNLFDNTCADCIAEHIDDLWAIDVEYDFVESMHGHGPCPPYFITGIKEVPVWITPDPNIISLHAALCLL
jgi:hypothetical protein